MREAFDDAQAWAAHLPCVDLAAKVDGAQRVINAASAVQAVRVAQYAAREQEQDATRAWVEVEHASSKNATACRFPGCARTTPNSTSPTTSSPSPAADQPQYGTCCASVNTTTGSNTTPAGT